MNIEQKLEKLGIILNTPKTPRFSYVPVKQIANILYISGHDCQKDGILVESGTLGKDLTIEQGQHAAKQCIINILSTVKAHIGDLDRIDECVKLLGFVQSCDTFKQQPIVMNAASNLLIDVFGDKGRHARSAIGVNTLPFDTPVEIELILKLKGE